MGKKGFNWKARQVVDAKVDNTETKKIKLDFQTSDYGLDPDGNDLVLPSKKRKTNIKKKKEEHARILTKAQRKKYEKILDTKKKKENRADLLEALSKVQIRPEELSKLIPITAAHTLGNRKLAELESADIEQPTTEVNKHKRITSIIGSRKRKRLILLSGNDSDKTTKNDPNVVGLDPSSSDSSAEESDNNDNKSCDVEIIPQEINPQEVVEEILDEPSEKSDKPQEQILIENKDLTSNVDPKTASTESEETKSTIVDCAKPHTKTIHENKRHGKTLINGLKFENIDTFHIDIERDPKIQVARLKLPILAEEQTVVECINENAIVILAGETGSGKTTQVPQFLYEAGYARERMIGVTEPRRVATVTMAARVGREMGLTSRQVSYLMRFEGNVTDETKIKFMTDGVLLKEIQTDFILSKYSVIIIDEAHQRSVYTDILIGLLSRIVPLRKKRGMPLRLIIMSATLRVEDFTENRRLFKFPPPVVKVESRQFPVTVHFNKRTPDNYMLEAFKKTVKIHTKLPEGGILVFVTGQQEVNLLVRRLRKTFSIRAKTVNSSKSQNYVKETGLDQESPDSKDIQSDDDEVEKEMKRAIRLRKSLKPKTIVLPKISLDDYDMPDDDGQADLIDDGANSDDDLEGMESDSDNDMSENAILAEASNCKQPLWVLPLYSMLAADKQAKVFQPPPPQMRLCVISTDVSETSLTIPGIKYVVDTGKKKIRLYDRVTGASAFRVTWTSQAGADQRRGRAGRTSAGHCYRLYSSAVYQHEFEKFPPPDIHRRPIDDLVLQMKRMGIDKVVNFPFPSPLEKLQLTAAEHRLSILGALEPPPLNTIWKKCQDEDMLRVTPLGCAISSFPVLPRYGKMLALSHQHSLLPYTVCMVAALSVQEVMIDTNQNWPATGNGLLLGDPGVLLRAVGAAEFANSKGELESFCSKHGLREKAVKEIRKLRVQLISEINLSVAGVDLSIDPKMEPPSETQARLLRQVLLSGLGDQVAKKIGIDEVKQDGDKRKFKYAYHCGEMEDPVFLHSGSILRKTIPEWLVYQEVYEAGHDETNSKTIMRGATAIEPEWLPTFVPKLCNLGDPLTDPPPRYNNDTGRVLCHVNATFGRAGWQLPTVEIDYPLKQDLYRWFAVFILDGSVCKGLQKYVKSLLSPPQTMVKSWARSHPKTEAMYASLASKGISTKASLLDEWNKQSNYLLEAYLKWIPESAHNEVTLLWPPTT